MFTLVIQDLYGVTNACLPVCHYLSAIAPIYACCVYGCTFQSCCPVCMFVLWSVYSRAATPVCIFVLWLTVYHRTVAPLFRVCFSVQGVGRSSGGRALCYKGLDPPA